jgi:hypothetical protein
MNKSKKSIEEYFAALRSTEPKSFDTSRKIIEASALLREHGSILSALRLDVALLAKRYFDLALIPLISAGLSVMIIIGSGSTLGNKTNKSEQPYADLLRTPSSPTFKQIGTEVAARRKTIPVNYEKIIQYQAVQASNNPDISQSISLILPHVDNINGEKEKSIYLNQSLYSIPPERYTQGFSVGVQSILLQRSPGSVVPYTSSPFQNGSISLSYRLDANQSVGIAIGQECFAKEIITPVEMIVGDPITGNSAPKTINQKIAENKPQTYFGAFYSHSLPGLSFFTVAHPFVQMLLGAVSNSVLVKGQAGYYVSFENNIDCRIAVAANYLNYPIEGNRQHSFKYALSVGIGFNW